MLIAHIISLSSIIFYSSLFEMDRSVDSPLTTWQFFNAAGIMISIYDNPPCVGHVGAIC